DEPDWNSTKRVAHPGTFNANPLAAVAGATCLEIVSDPAVQQHCDAMADRFKQGANAALIKHDVPGFVWGESSVFHIYLGERCDNLAAEPLHTPEGIAPEVLKKGTSPALAKVLECGMLLEGSHLFHGGGLLSMKHTE